ncbi:MAG: hypothetical protein H7232_13215 [Aeromicrobium sp.]|nr:hypothetical protein [Burkholderiales bacterium]
MKDADTIQQALKAFAVFGLTATLQKRETPMKKGGADAFARLAKDNTQIDIALEAKHAVTPATLGAILTQTKAQRLEHGRPVILATRYVTPPMAERLREAGQQFIDIAGNAYLEAPGWLIFVVGRRPAETGVPTHAAKAGTPAGLKVLFALLCDPTLIERPQREIANEANVALGAIPGVLNDLRDQGHVLVMPGIRRLIANKRLLDEWAMAYARTMRPKTLVAAFNAPTIQDWQKWALDPAELRWGGEPAAALLTNHLRPGVLTIYTEKLPARFTHEHRLTKVPNDHRGRLEATVEVRKPFWGAALQLHYDHVGLPNTLGQPKQTVPPVLVYADLLAMGDARCIETAEILYENTIAPHLTAR